MNESESVVATILRLEADVSPFERSMQDAAKAMEKSTAKMQAAVKSLNDKMRAGFDSVGASIKGAAVAMAADLGSKLLSKIVDGQLGTAKWAAEAEKLADNLREVSAEQDRLMSARLTRAAERGPEAELEQLRKEISRAEFDRGNAARDAAAKRAKFEAHDFGGSFSESSFAAGEYLTRNFERMDKLLKDSADAADAAAKKASDRIKELTDKSEKLRKAISDAWHADKRKLVDDFAESVKREGEVFGMTADQLKLYEARVKGAGEEQLKLFKMWQDQKNALIAAKATMAFAGGFGLMQNGPEAAAPTDWGKGTDALAGGSSAARNAIIAAGRSTSAAGMTPQNSMAKSADEISKALASISVKLGDGARREAEAVGELRAISEKLGSGFGGGISETLRSLIG